MTRHFISGVALVVIGLGAAYIAHALEISGVTITNVTETSAVIEWSTDKPSDGTVNFGTDPRGGFARDPSFSNKKHAITIEELIPATRYYISVSSSDSEGNKNTATGYIFTTKSPPNASQKVVQEIRKISDPKELEIIRKEVQEQLQDVLKPPSIVGLPRVTPSSNKAIISWTTDRPSNSMVRLAPETEYQSGAANPYTISQGDPQSSTTKHEVEVIGLEPSTVYHFQVVSEDASGLSGASDDETFRTRSLMPEVIGLRVTRVQESSATISWSTGGVRAKGIVEYKNLRTNATKSSGNAIFATQHSINLTGLELGTRYSVTAISTNEGGESVSSDPITFVTVRDVVSPLITKVKNESTLFPGEDVKIQTIFAWETDEPATCQVFYAQGLIAEGGDNTSALPEELNPITVHTQVVVGFAPATVYKYWMKCKDPSRNESQTEDYVLITPIKEKSIIDIILENFEGTFGWVKNISN